MITMAREHDTSRTVRAPAAAPTVFVLDDDEPARDSLQRLAQALGWRAETFASAQAFLARDRVRVPSCLIIRMAMPDVDGLDVQRRVAAGGARRGDAWRRCSRNWSTAGNANESRRSRQPGRQALKRG